jgi:hypothetical protein
MSAAWPEEGGKKTGQSMTHYVDPNGKFIKAFKRLKEAEIYKPSFSLESGAAKGKGKNGGRSKTKYACPCGNKVWGKPGLIIVCGACEKEIEPGE